jgi:DNA-binding NtrC family response regulator
MKFGGRILVIDDNEEARELLKTILSEKGYQILEAGDGEQALEVMSTSLIHMAIVDLDMPRMNGIEFSKRAKAARPDLPIIMVTAYSQFYVPADSCRSPSTSPAYSRQLNSCDPCFKNAKKEKTRSQRCIPLHS